jgi:hypothetical protein
MALALDGFAFQYLGRSARFGVMAFSGILNDWMEICKLESTKSAAKVTKSVTIM